jgi:hypothetical protein
VDRERATSPRLTESDRAGPIAQSGRADLIDDGKAIIEKALRGEAPVSPTRSCAPTRPPRRSRRRRRDRQAAPAPIQQGQEVSVTYPDGETFTARIDEIDGDAYRVTHSQTGEASEIMAGEARIAPVAPSAPAQGSQATTTTEATATPPVTAPDARSAPIDASEPPRIQINSADWVTEPIYRDRDASDRLGLTREIEKLSFDGRTARQIAVAVADRLGQDVRDAQMFVRHVRASLGIPSMDDRTDFGQWRASVADRVNATTPRTLQLPRQNPLPRARPHARG